MTAAELAAAPTQRPVTAAMARSHVRALLGDRAERADASPTMVDDILLVVTELVTNAVRHGGGLLAFDATLDGDLLTLEVTDASPTVPHTVPRTRAATPGGFGWPLVQQLSREVTVTPTAQGKTIRVVMAAGPDA
ncbi:ATP-binding protein [Streptomyces sp. KAU_LT]|uniref:ATP-binding protein n=1 Tax=Streptomyces sp. KAU_LT TaxID=3046669 RepID=UPI0024B793FD|nr:ATP-binding protein [Streptomyces sp. KAU_LT]MDI9835367.1 ATP-binding protein [Streptomyces sp. KAU_LT]